MQTMTWQSTVRNRRRLLKDYDKLGIENIRSNCCQDIKCLFYYYNYYPKEVEV